jgi:hypothetical protein
MNAIPPIEIKNRQGRITADRIEWIAKTVGGRSYLEIGVFDGETFTNVGLERKVAVDPNFRFDWQKYQTGKVSLHPITSDAFFATQKRELFDVIFIDGLHTFAQSFRDFCATMALAHDRTVWLIDDTVPNDIFSMMPDYKQTHRLRELHKVDSMAWHGDVFRTAFAIHDFFPTLDMRTITSFGNPQTIVTKNPRADFAPRWNDLEKIARLEFADFDENRDCMRPATEEEAKTWLRSVFADR